MADVKIPDGYNHLMPYLIIENATGFLDFAVKVFGATERHKAMRDETVIMHAEIAIGDSVVMFADATDTYSSRPAGMFLYVADCDATYQTALDNGATSVAPPTDQSYGRGAGVLDPFGNTWWITAAQ